MDIPASKVALVEIKTFKSTTLLIRVDKNICPKLTVEVHTKPTNTSKKNIFLLVPPAAGLK